MTDHKGGCHCGNIAVTFTTDKKPSDIAPRACQCSFCRKHATRALSDNQGHIHISVKDGSALGKYRFGQHVGDYVFCKNCGVYVSAYMDDGDKAFANVMANAMDDRDAWGPDEAIHYDGEDEAGKRARRRIKWTPASMTVEG
ncbi:MAG: GFA family protein [Rhodospirillaceae bacterium]